eukprot:2811717-Prymnesium_polylepis.1
MLPPGAQCLRRCLMSFHSLDLQQDTSLLDSSVQAELLWHNNRFTIAGLSAHQQQKWAERYDTNRILSLLDSDGTELTDEAWDYYFLNMAPAHLQGSPAFHLERDTLMAELACIRRDVPTEVIAATACPEIADGDTVVLTTDDTVDYVDVEKTEGGFTYHELCLDTHGRPHRTGDTLDQLPDGVVITHVELWNESPEHKEPGEELAEEPEYEDDDEPGKLFPDPRPAIMGPITTTFPRNDGCSE